MKNLLVATLLATTVGTTLAQQDTLKIDDVIVTATKFNDEKENIVRPVYEITAQQIENHPASMVSELLNTIPNVHISETYGNAGANQNYYSRGGRAKDVLILINGIPMSDDSQISNFEDLNMIPKEQIKKIEVLNSGASTLYGASASTGLINIILKDATSSPLLRAKLQVGKWGTLEQGIQAGATTKNNKVSGLFSFNRTYTNGFSAATDQNLDDEFNFDDDASDRYAINGAITVRPTKNLSLQLLGSASEHDFDFDGGAFFDNNNRQQNDKKYAQLIANYDYSIGAFTLKSSTAHYERATKGFYSTEFDSKNLNADFYNLLKFKNIDIVKGIYYKQTKANAYDNYSGTFTQTISDTIADYKVIDPYVAVNINFNGLLADVGGRYHTHNNYDGKFVYHGNLGYQFELDNRSTLNIRGGINTAYNTPSLYQNYSIYGDTNLTPEEFRTIEGGIDLFLFDQLDLSATYFTRKEENAIAYGQRADDSFGYLNTGKENDAKGFETRATMNWNEFIQSSAFYATTKVDDNALFYKQPKNEFGVGLTASTPFKTSLTTDYRRVGDRVMTSFPPPTYVLTEQNVDAYNMLNATISQLAWKEQIRFYLNANNILNEEIIDNLGYNSQDFNMNVGVVFQLQ